MKPRFDYGHYINSLQDAEEVKKNLAAFVPFFNDCKKVLDLGCGTGLFLQLLQDAGIQAVGVDADSVAVAQAEASGLNVIQADVLQFLKNTHESFDGIFCSHLVEHLPFADLIELIEGITSCLAPEGTLLIAFPNPESLDMHLFHFWLDPQHVRFYHPKLIEAMLAHYGLPVQSRMFRDWRNGGKWINGKCSVEESATNGRRRPLRRIGGEVKRLFGITRLENEVDYLSRLRNIGEEAVITARKAL